MLISIKQKEDMNIIIFIKLILTICLILFNYKILYFQKIYNNNQKNIVLLMLPQHGNLGDQAISLAEIFFLKKIFKKLRIIYNLNDYANYINKNSLIFLQGGGNMGWRYSYEEKNRRTIIERYPNNRIIIFPQTIDFEKDKKEENNSRIIYSRHKYLTLIAREKESLRIMSILFKNNTITITDRAKQVKF